MNYDLGIDIDNGVKKYFSDLSTFNPLSKEEEHRLLKRYRYENDLSARDKLIKSNLRFATSIASNYRGRGISFNELISEANEGLLESIEKFDLKQDIKLFSYSVWWIRQRVLAAIEKKGKMPTSELPSDYETQVDKEDDEALTNEQPYQYLEPAFIEEETRREDEDDRKKFLDEVFKTLSERERDMINMSYGVYGKEYTLEEIGKKYGITKERARQIIEHGLTKARCNAMLVKSKYL